jgi:hypothetical protein
MSRPAFWPKLAGASLAHPGDRARVGQGHRLHRLERLLVATAHHGEQAVHRAGLAAGDRRIDEVKPALAGRGVQLARHFGGGGGVVHEDGARPHAGKRPGVPQCDGTQVVVIAHAGEDDVCTLGRLVRRRRMPAAELCAPGLRLGRGAVEHRHLVSRTSQVPRHRVAHHPQAEEGHLLRRCGVVGLGGGSGHLGLLEMTTASRRGRAGSQ